MTPATAQRTDQGATEGTTQPAAWITPLLAAACGMIVANLYYAQPLVGPIARALQLSPEIAGLIVTLTQMGYCAGLVLLVPLGDIVENRKLILTLIAGCAVALTAAALASHASVFLIAGCAIGLCSVAVQVLVPFAAHLAPDHARGRAVGNVTSGLLMGIMLARPVSSLVSGLFGWHTIFAASAVAMVLLSLLALTAAAILLDFGVSANLVIGQRAIFALSAEHRSRLNGLYMAIFFVGGAIGSSVGAWAFARGGWPLASWIGFALPALALLYFRTDRT